MQKSNTTGIKWHLKTKHPLIHEKLHPEDAVSSQKSRKTLEEAFGSSSQREV